MIQSQIVEDLSQRRGSLNSGEEEEVSMELCDVTFRYARRTFMKIHEPSHDYLVLTSVAAGGAQDWSLAEAGPPGPAGKPSATLLSRDTLPLSFIAQEANLPRDCRD